MNLSLSRIIAIFEFVFEFIHKSLEIALSRMTYAEQRSLSIRMPVFVFLFLFCLGANTQISAQSVQDIQVTGNVTDTEGNALPGVSILVKGSSQGAVTGLEGEFLLTVESGDAILVFNYIGFIPQEVQVGNRKEIDVELIESVSDLDEFVVVGYGTQRKENLSGSVASVSGETITERPAPNVQNLLQGRVAG